MLVNLKVHKITLPVHEMYTKKEKNDHVSRNRLKKKRCDTLIFRKTTIYKPLSKNNFTFYILFIFVEFKRITYYL